MEITDKDKYYIEAQVKRAWGWSAQRSAVKRRAFLGSNLYRCEGCEEFIFKIDSRASYEQYLTVSHYARPSKLAVDHINPVVPITGWIDNNDFGLNIVKRQFCGEDNLQLLCSDCHYWKTQIENKERGENKKCIK